MTKIRFPTPYHSVGTQRRVYYGPQRAGIIYIRTISKGIPRNLLGRDPYDPLRAVIDKNTFSHAISFCRDPEKGLHYIDRDYKQGYELGRDSYDPLRAVIDKNTFSHAISFCRDPEKGLLWSAQGRD